MSKTYHTIIKHNMLLQDIANYYNVVKRKIFARLCRNNYLLFKNNSSPNKPSLINSINSKEVTEFSKKFNMTSRQIKSINFELKALINSQVEIRLDILKDKKEIFKKIEKEINTLEKEINKSTLLQNKKIYRVR